MLRLTTKLKVDGWLAQASLSYLQYALQDDGETASHLVAAAALANSGPVDVTLCFHSHDDIPLRKELAEKLEVQSLRYSVSLHLLCLPSLLPCSKLVTRISTAVILNELTANWARGLYDLSLSVQ